MTEPQPESVAIVVVTYNRADLLSKMLDGLAALTRPADKIYVVNNASSDHTRQVLDERDDLPLTAIHSEENLGGAGGFHLGVRTAYDAGHDRIWLMDDDVVPAPDCLTIMLDHDGPCLAAVREDSRGNLVEKAATHFDLRNPLAIRPKRTSVETVYGTREAMPAEVGIQNAAFEGFLVKREVIDAIGLPDPSYFIFYDDVDFVVRAARAGFPALALRDAVLVRQLDFDQQHALDTWKGFYMYRNLFVVHFRYGENVLVRFKPYLITLAVILLSPLRGGRSEAANVFKAIRSAQSMKVPPPANQRSRRIPSDGPTP
ncbi:glycosyltransferase family 2 protein [Nocardioides speluncae]|uniref:glycosyltransferase family 2 protein n=1 Tax=Nocardioides speluncae TaxID=2670337 RepID=UPI000D690E0B|nr:glycosyltransferase family 2 protein [Nocardioides speluncae]